MKRKETDILFSQRFHQIAQCLGIFSYLYTQRGGKGIERSIFTEETRNCINDTTDILSFLEKHHIIEEEHGILHLNSNRFFSMSLWDLLILAEPWTSTIPSKHHSIQTHQSSDVTVIKDFAQSQSLSDFYVNTYH